MFRSCISIMTKDIVLRTNLISVLLWLCCFSSFLGLCVSGRLIFCLVFLFVFYVLFYFQSISFKRPEGLNLIQVSPHLLQADQLVSISSRQFWQPLSFPRSWAGQSSFSEHLSAVFTTSILWVWKGTSGAAQFQGLPKAFELLTS